MGGADEIADSLIKNFTTKNGRKVMDARGVYPDIKIEPSYYSKLSEILIYNDHIFNYVNRHKIENLAKISLEDYSISEKEYNDFKSYLSDKDINYSNESEQALSQLIAASKQEDYYKANQQALQELKEKLKPDLAKDLDRNSQEIKQMLESELVSRTHFQKGRIEISLKSDPYIEQAKTVLMDTSKYNTILNK